MSAEVFMRRWLGLFALLSGLIVFAPFLSHAVVTNSGCGDTIGACASLQATLDYHSSWLVLAIVLAPLIVAIAARTLTMSIFAWAFPFALLMMAGAMPLFVQLSAFREPNYLENLLALPALIPLLFLVVLLLALSVGSDEDKGAAGAWKAILGFVALAAAFVSAPAWLLGLASIPYAGQFAPMLAYYLGLAHGALGIAARIPQLVNTALVGFTLAAAGTMLASREGHGGGGRQRLVFRA
ncbi:hypothetical protein OF829_16985 [Sphingomonas sp. LB-2]|uniref:hypothetical protein n=1 Tax=Sphingomonas caeni TaxID=2984949 RepID=UPI00222F6828|nr:hypothetical protein [Sphingomonas caeni]MCW3848935.1 hypothetical protein [Sphingomonas caeni]